MQPAADPIEEYLLATCGMGVYSPDAGVALRKKHQPILAQSLVASVAAGLVEVVREHLRQGGAAVAVRPTGPMEWPPILYACRSTLADCESPFAAELTEVVESLLAAGADPDTRFPSERSSMRAPILFAAAALHGNESMTRALLAAGAGVEFGETLVNCAFKDHWGCFDALLAGGADIDRTTGQDGLPSLHSVLDRAWTIERMQALLDRGADPDFAAGPLHETALHVAGRRRRLEAIQTLLDRGVQIDAKTAGGKTAYAHAARRTFDEVAGLLAERGADRALTPADELAVALCHGDLQRAEEIHLRHPEAAASRNPEEARIAADLAGRERVEALDWLLDSGGDPDAPGMDGGTPLHQAAWFGQLECARLLIQRGANLELRDPSHEAPPIGWVAHGSLYSDTAAERVDAYVQIARALVDAGARIPKGLDAAPKVLEVLRSR